MLLAFRAEEDSHAHPEQRGSGKRQRAVLIEQSAYANRWRKVCPEAKGIFALSGFIAAFAASRPDVALLVASLLAATTIAGAGISPCLLYTSRCV